MYKCMGREAVVTAGALTCKLLEDQDTIGYNILLFRVSNTVSCSHVVGTQQIFLELTVKCREPLME